MTRKLYYEDSYISQFHAVVLLCEPDNEGYKLLLDQTAFYPEGGGQPADTGTLNGVQVKHVSIEGEKIIHWTNTPLEEGSLVEGNIDFRRRFDYMQQHSGEHIISGIIAKQYGYKNVGFHMSDMYMTADFDGAISVDALKKIEQEANQVVYKNIPILGECYDKSQILDRAYRSKIELEGVVRLVSVEGYDDCACCGTHVKRTGEIGVIKIINGEKYKKGIRLTLLCGERAVQDYSSKQMLLEELSQHLSAQPQNIRTHIMRLQEELVELKRKVANRTGELFSLKAMDYIAEPDSIICIEEDGLSGEEVKRLCMAITEKCKKVCFVSIEDEGRQKYVLGCQEGDVRGLCQHLNQVFCGRGGGSKELCQGSLVGNIKQVKKEIGLYLKI